MLPLGRAVLRGWPCLMILPQPVRFVRESRPTSMSNASKNGLRYHSVEAASALPHRPFRYGFSEAQSAFGGDRCNNREVRCAHRSISPMRSNRWARRVN